MNDRRGGNFGGDGDDVCTPSAGVCERMRASYADAGCPVLTGETTILACFIGIGGSAGVGGSGTDGRGSEYGPRCRWYCDLFGWDRPDGGDFDGSRCFVAGLVEGTGREKVGPPHNVWLFEFFGE